MNESFDQKPLKSWVRPPLIPTGEEQEKQEESFVGSLVRLVAQTGESAAEILGGVFPILKKKHQYPPHHLNYSSAQESYVIPHEDEPPSIDRAPTPKKTYAFMAKDSEKMQQLRQSRAFYSGWDGVDLQKQSKKHQYHAQAAHTYYEQTPDATNEIVFGAVQEQDKKIQNVVIKPLDHGIPFYDHHKIRSRSSYSRGA